MKKHRFSLIALSAITLSACASGYYGPVYEPARSSSDSGYSEYRIDDNRFRVQYRIENGDLELAQDWALRRAAEVTLNQRYDWFQIISRNRTFRDDDFERYDRFRSYNDRYYERPRFDQRFDDDAVVIIEVIMGNNPPPRSASVYDARQVLDYTRGRTRY
ncbi:CC0125/CC1285 family lipoprotein [Hyphococcus sp. DH-69]|uniref:CC0125/CC1285 family lipoprotein n=1 Tax=Hyphococcus formosus TaxID=3143534 RepID=UPI00398B0B39